MCADAESVQMISNGRAYEVLDPFAGIAGRFLPSSTAWATTRDRTGCRIVGGARSSENTDCATAARSRVEFLRPVNMRDAETREGSAMRSSHLHPARA